MPPCPAVDTFLAEKVRIGVLVAESVELAPILLTDLVGSTRLATTVEPVRADALREERTRQHCALEPNLSCCLGHDRGKIEHGQNTGGGVDETPALAFESANRSRMVSHLDRR